MSGDTPVEGLYKLRWVRRGPWMAVRIWYDSDRYEPDSDPPNPLDRSAIWRAERDGLDIGLEFVWPYAANNPIDQREYDWLLADASHARRYRSNSPEANPNRAIDLAKLPSIF